MSSFSSSFPDLLAACQKLLAAVEAHEVELPEVGHYKTDLELALAEAKASKIRQIDLEKRRKLATQDVREQTAECRELAMRLKSLILAHYGPRDERLPVFGIRLGGKTRRKPPERRSENSSPGYH